MKAAKAMILNKEAQGRKQISPYCVSLRLKPIFGAKITKKIYLTEFCTQIILFCHIFVAYTYKKSE